MKNSAFLKTFLLILLLLGSIACACNLKPSDPPPEQFDETDDQENVPESGVKEEGYIGTGGRKTKPHHTNADMETVTDEFEIQSGRKDDPVSIYSFDAYDPDPSIDDPSYSDSGGKEGHWKYRDVLIAEAWDETVLLKEGYYESVLVSDAWDEEVTYCAIFGSTMIEVEVCNSCGAQFQGGINEHLSQTGHSGWHNEYVAVDEPHCQSYESYTIHHDAVYRDLWHEPEYGIVHHDAVYKREKYWVDD